MRYETKITVFTPTYNRAYILENLYRSIRRQSFRDFEWLVIDDGSTDETEALINRWIEEDNVFTIRYYKQPNGGKCRAINRALDLARGELFLVVDSDDYLTDDALAKIAGWAGRLPDDGRYCGVSGNLGTSENDTPNRLVEGGFYDGTLLDRYRMVNGERLMAFFTEVHRRYRYPVFSGETFMTEAVAYNRMAHDGYRMRFFNDVVCIYAYLEDGLTRAGNKLFLENPRGYALWLREKAEFLNKSVINRFRMWYSYYCEMSFCEDPYRLTKRQCAEYLGAPVGVIYAAAAVHKLRHLRG